VLNRQAVVANRIRNMNESVLDETGRLLALPRVGKDEYKEKDLTARQPKIFNMFSGEECLVKLRCIEMTILSKSSFVSVASGAEKSKCFWRE
jgi:hypothetical protein